MPSFSFRNLVGQCIWIPNPTLTEKNLQDLSGKVILVTGGNSGLGYQLANILYSANGTVYIAGRNVEKCQKAISVIKDANQTSTGRLEYLKLDLADLTTIKSSAEDFLSREKRLDVLINNAGVMTPPKGSVTAQGYDLQIGTNVLGPYLFTQLLRHILKATAASSTANSVRVAWPGSISIHLYPPSGGVEFDDEGVVKLYDDTAINYGVSKCGSLFLANAFANDTKDDGIVSVCYNPGNLRTELMRHVPFAKIGIMKYTFEKAFQYEPIYGAYTQLYCGFSNDITTEDNGTYFAPWGRKSFVRKDIQDSMKSMAEGGTGILAKFADYCQRETKKYL